MADYASPTLSAAPPPAPKPAWMWKPRSKLVDSEKSSSVTAFLRIRSVGAKQWRRRFLFVDRDSICYGNEPGTRDKVVPFEAIQDANFVPKADVLKRKAPHNFADYGWHLHVQGRHLLFCAESEAAVNEWVHFVRSLLAHMRSLRAPVPAVPAPAETIPARSATPPTSGTVDLSDSPARHEGHHTQATILHPLNDHFTTVSPGPLPQVPKCDSTRAASDDADDSEDSSDTDGAFSQTHALAPSDEDVDEEDTESGNDTLCDSRPSSSIVSRTTDDSNRLQPSSSDTLGTDDDSDSDDTTPSRQQTTLATPQASEPDNASTADSAEGQLAMRFLPLAQGTHSHIAFRVPALAEHFKGGDTPQSVVFSRSLEKIGKRDNVQQRDLVLTSSFLYLFTRKHVGNGTHARAIPVSQIIGVVISPTAPEEVAVLVPSFHDVLLRVTPQNSRIGGTEAQVKEQLIAHLFKVHRTLGTGRRFVYRVVPDIRAVIRRSTEDKHQSLDSTPEDITHAATCPAIYPIFRANGDGVVCWSSVVRQVRADRKPVLRVVVVTDGAVYVVQDNLSKIVRRASLDTVVALLFDADSQSILIQCGHAADILFSVQEDTDFHGLLRVIPETARQSFGRHVRTTPSKQLYAHARLVQADPLLAHSAFTAASVDSATVASAGAPAAPKARSGHHTLSRQLKALWKAGMGKENRYEVHATKAATTARVPTAGDSDDDSDGDPLHAPGGGGEGERAASSAEQALYAMYRFVEEVVLDYDDALHLLEAVPPTPGAWDSLAVQQRFTIPSSLGTTLLASTPCCLFDAKEVTAWAKSTSGATPRGVTGTKRGLCVTPLGIVLLKGVDPPEAGLRVARPGGTGPLSALGGKAGRLLLRSAATRVSPSATTSGAVDIDAATKGLPALDDTHVAVQLPWADIIALVRCRLGQTPLIGIMTARNQPQDLLVQLPDEEHMLEVMTAAAQSYAATRVTKAASVSAFGGSLPLFAAPRTGNVARALKKAPFDPFPTVSMRHTAPSYRSDALRMAVVPEVADVCRRFGDNTVFFSGVAWRIRSATLRHENGVITQDPGARLCRHNNNLYKSYILLLTNCALYHCAKGGFEVMRRTSLLDLEAVYLSTSDPDTIMLTVPSEYDMYFRLEGRGREFLARLQEAYVEWTNYAWYRPHEHQGAHRLEDYFLPIHRVPTVATHGQLTKPLTFNALQANRSPTSVRTKMLRWHERHLNTALAHFERAVEVGRTGVSRSRAKSAQRRRGSGAGWNHPQRDLPLLPTSGSGVGGADVPTTRVLGWPEVRERLALAQSFLYFNHRRCFRAGVRGDEYPAMIRAQVYLAQYAKLQEVVRQLESVAAMADMEAYERVLREASGYPELGVLIAEQSAHYEVFRRRQLAVKSVLSLAMQATSNENDADPIGSDGEDVSLARSLPELACQMRAAAACGVDACTLHLLRFYVDTLAQREQLAQRLASDRGRRWLASPPNKETWTLPRRRTLVQVVSRSLFLPVSDHAAPDAGLSSQPPLFFGLCYLLSHHQHAWARTVLNRAVDTTHNDNASLSSLKAQMERVLVDRETADALARLSARLAQHQRAQDWTIEGVRQLYRTCKTLARRVPADDVAYALCHDVLRLHMDSLAVRHAALARRAQLEQREQHARHFYDEETARQNVAEARAEAQRAAREQAAHLRRRDAFYSTWRTRVQRLGEDLRQAMDENHDSDKVRLVGRQCVQLQLELNQSVKAYAEHHPTATTAPPAAGASDEKAQLLAFIADLSGRARDYLIRETHAGANPYAPHDKRANPTATATGASDGRGDCERDGAGAATPSALQPIATPPPPTLPEALQVVLAAGDAQGVVQYVRQHGPELSAAAIEEVRVRWREAAQQRKWVEDFRRGLAAAVALRSAALLRWHLGAAAAKDYHGPEVAHASQLSDALQSATSAEAQYAVWDGECHSYWPASSASGSSSASHGNEGATQDIVFDEVCRPPTAAGSMSFSRASSSSSASLDADSDICLDSPADDPVDSRHSEATSADEAPDCSADQGRPNEDVPSRALAPEAVMQAATPAVMPSPLQAFVRVRFPILEWPTVSQMVEEMTTAADKADSAHCGDECLEACQSLEAVLLHFLRRPCNVVRGAPEDASCTVLCPLDNPDLPDLLFHWMQVWTRGLRPEGLVHKTPRHATDVLERVAGRRSREGVLLSPHTNHLMGLFIKANRFQTVRGPASDFAFVAYMLQERVMEDVLLETSRLEEKERTKLMASAAPLRHVSLLGNLLSLAHLCASIVVPMDVRQPQQLHQLLVRAAQQQATPPQPVSRAAASTAESSGASPAEPREPVVQAATDTAGAAPTPPPGTATEVAQASTTAAQARAASLAACTGAMRRAVATLTQYFTDEVAATPPPSLQGAAVATLQRLFDEHAHPALIPVLTKALEPALLALLESGFQTRYQLVRTRSLWHMFERFAQHLRGSSRSLVGVEVVAAVELVDALTGEDGRYRASLEALTEVERGRACTVIFLRQCLNRNCLADALEALFPSAEEDQAWGGEEGVWAFYDPNLCVLAPRGDPHVDRLRALLHTLSRFPFSTAVDRALW